MVRAQGWISKFFWTRQKTHVTEAIWRSGKILIKWHTLSDIWATSWQNQQIDMHPEKTQISLDICPVWSESSLSTWKQLRSLAVHWAHSKDSDQTGWMPRLQADLSLHWAHRSFCWFCYEVAHFCFISIIWKRRFRFCYVYTVMVKTDNITIRSIKGRITKLSLNVKSPFLWNNESFYSLLENTDLYLQHDKTNKMTCAQRRLRSACASTQSLLCAQ